MVWAIDPIDGTANFVNGYPLFAASIGVLYRGRPLAGALWCAASHALRSGVYHARSGVPLSFDDQPIEPKSNLAVRRWLAGVPNAGAGRFPWDIRVSGSAIECAFVAAGLMRVARFARPNLWDIAGGVALVKAAGGDVVVRSAAEWFPWSGSSPRPTLRRWPLPISAIGGSSSSLASGRRSPYSVAHRRSACGARWAVCQKQSSAAKRISNVRELPPRAAIDVDHKKVGRFAPWKASTTSSASAPSWLHCATHSTSGSRSD